MLHISFGITAYILFITFILGCCLGSFADCAAVRLVSGQSVLSGRSHCDSCGHVLGVLDLFPVLSWLLLKGNDLSVMSLQGILLGLILLIVSLTDLHSWIIPDRLHVAGVLVFLATTVFMPDPLHNILRGLLLGIALGGGMLVLSLLFDRLTGKESLGGGDIKLFFMTGLYLGSAWEILFYLILSCLLGLGFAALRKTQKLPFGPSIAAACFIMIVYGDVMTRWYTGLF